MLSIKSWLRVKHSKRSPLQNTLSYTLNNASWTPFSRGRGSAPIMTPGLVKAKKQKLGICLHVCGQI